MDKNRIGEYLYNKDLNGLIKYNKETVQTGFNNIRILLNIVELAYKLENYSASFSHLHDAIVIINRHQSKIDSQKFDNEIKYENVYIPIISNIVGPIGWPIFPKGKIEVPKVVSKELDILRFKVDMFYSVLVLELEGEKKAEDILFDSLERNKKLGETAVQVIGFYKNRWIIYQIKRENKQKAVTPEELSTKLSSLLEKDELLIKIELKSQIPDSILVPFSLLSEKVKLIESNKSAQLLLAAGNDRIIRRDKLKALTNEDKKESFIDNLLESIKIELYEKLCTKAGKGKPSIINKLNKGKDLFVGAGVPLAYYMTLPDMKLFGFSMAAAGLALILKSGLDAMCRTAKMYISFN